MTVELAETTLGPKRDRKAVSRSLQLITLGITGSIVAIAVFRSLTSSPQIGFGEATANPIDDLWVTVAAAMVFLMQAGFMAFEVGLARPHHAPAVALKNLVDWACLLYTSPSPRDA